MKKLMIAAAAAAMIGGAQAVTCVSDKVCVKDQCTGEKVCTEKFAAGTAHKVTISLKTTANKAKTKKDACGEDCTYWRQQTTKKINGLLWEQLIAPDDVDPDNPVECPQGCDNLVGTKSAFWTNDGVIRDVNFDIGVGLIGKGVDSKKIEAYGGLNGDGFGYLAWAGFGSLATSGKKTDCSECTGYVKSISGGIAGQLIPADWDDVCQECLPIEYKGCCDDIQLVNTAAYGTIKISYDKATAKKVALADADDVDDITSFYKLPKAVSASMFEDGELTFEPGEVGIEE